MDLRNALIHQPKVPPAAAGVQHFELWKAGLYYAFASLCRHGIHLMFTVADSYTRWLTKPLLGGGFDR
jgi:hypothetical protein